MRVKLNRDEIHQALTTNMQDWKKYADIEEVQDLNDSLDTDTIITICSSQFFDDISDHCLEVSEVLDNNFLDDTLNSFTRESFILIHNIYNV